MATEFGSFWYGGQILFSKGTVSMRKKPEAVSYYIHMIYDDVVSQGKNIVPCLELSPIAITATKVGTLW